MQVQFFLVPIQGGDDAAEELNRFLGSHRIVSIDRQFVQDGPGSAWAFCVTYIRSSSRPDAVGKRGKVDYREVLSEQDFAVFARLRALRKTLADREGVPAYALFTNEQLAEMVQRRVRTADALSEIAGVGASRVEKHGEDFLAILCADGPPPAKEGDLS